MSIVSPLYGVPDATTTTSTDDTTGTGGSGTRTTG